MKHPDFKRTEKAFLKAFTAGDVDSARAVLKAVPIEIDTITYQAHEWLRAFIQSNKGHCYRKSHLQIADLLIPKPVIQFRTVILSSNLNQVKKQLRKNPALVHAEFTAGRGIGRSIHHWKDPAIAICLMQAGAEMDVTTTLGDTPLMMQLRFGTMEGVKVLLEHGADPNKGTGGHFPSESMEARIQLMLSYGWDIHRGQLLHDARHGFGKRVMTWLKYGANPNAQTSQGQTALHLIASRGTGQKVIQALVEAGSDMNKRDKNGNTPLDLALSASRTQAATSLKALGGVTSKK